MSTPATSATLLGRLAVGETREEAWSQFVERYGPTVLRWCRKHGCPESELEDMLQEVLIKLLSAFKKFQYAPHHSFRAWLSTVTKNAVVDWLRSSQSKLLRPGEAIIHRLIDNVAVQEELGAGLHAEFRTELFHQACQLARPEFDECTWKCFELTSLLAIPSNSAAIQLDIPLANLYVYRSRVLARIRLYVERMQAELND